MRFMLCIVDYIEDLFCNNNGVQILLIMLDDPFSIDRMGFRCRLIRLGFGMLDYPQASYFCGEH